MSKNGDMLITRHIGLVNKDFRRGRIENGVRGGGPIAGAALQSRRRLFAGPGKVIFVCKVRNKMKTKLAKSSVGRVILHLGCMVRDGQMRWHWEGIMREVAK